MTGSAHNSVSGGRIGLLLQGRDLTVNLPPSRAVPVPSGLPPRGVLVGRVELLAAVLAALDPGAGDGAPVLLAGMGGSARPRWRWRPATVRRRTAGSPAARSSSTSRAGSPSNTRWTSCCGRFDFKVGIADFRSSSAC